MKTAQAIIEWYDTYEPEKHGLEPLQKARQRLSVYCTSIAEQIHKLEPLHKVSYHERKIAEAEAFVTGEGTNAERTASSVNRELRIQEAKYEGELQGLKIMLNTYFKVLDSMASQINVLNR